MRPTTNLSNPHIPSPYILPYNCACQRPFLHIRLARGDWRAWDGVVGEVVVNVDRVPRVGILEGARDGDGGAQLVDPPPVTVIWAHSV
jgi:hypothetical protein